MDADRVKAAINASNVHLAWVESVGDSFLGFTLSTPGEGSLLNEQTERFVPYTDMGDFFPRP